MERSRDRRGGSRLPAPHVLLERVRQLRHLATTQDKYDVAAWVRAVEDLKAMPISDDVRTAYEEVLAIFPSAASVWARYTESELSSGGDLDAAKTLFGRCLLYCPSLELHHQYLRLVKRSNEPRGSAGLAEVRLAYEFSLDTVGQDIGAGSLWQEYLQFIQGPKPGSDAFAALFPGALEGQEESTRMGVVRKTYQRAVVIPTHQVEALWRNYESWEIKMDRQLGKKVLDEWRPRYQAARGVLRHRKRKVDPLITSVLPFPPGKGGPMQPVQASLWHQYITFEKSNLQKLEPESPLLMARVTLAYNQCLTILWNYPEVWFDNAVWQHDTGGSARSVPVLERAQIAIPGCALLRFARADMEEGAGNFEAAQQVYEAMAAQLEAEVYPYEEGEEEGEEEGDVQGQGQGHSGISHQQEGSAKPQEDGTAGDGQEDMDLDASVGAAAQGAQGVGGEGKQEGKEGELGQAGDTKDSAAERVQGEGLREQGAIKAEGNGGSGHPDLSAGGAGRVAGGAEEAKEGTQPKQEGQGNGQTQGREEGKSEERKKEEGEGKGEGEKRGEEVKKEADRTEGERKEGMKKGKKEKERERKERRDRRRKEMEKKDPEVQLSPFGVEQGALIWVQYMRFLRRTQDPTASRQLFLRARRWQQQSRAITLATEAAAAASTAGRPPLANGGPRVEPGKGGTPIAAGPTGWQVYAAMARMEWASDRSNKAIACRIFEKGLEDPKLAKDPAYTLAYHRFLLDAGDVDNARALFERTLAEPELLGCGELWRAYAAFEYEQGDLPAALQVESRMREAMASVNGAEAERDYEKSGGGIDVGISGTLLQQSLQLALLKYTFEGAAPCTSQLQRHLLGSAGVLKGPSAEEEAAIAERFVQMHPEQFQELLPPVVLPPEALTAGKGFDLKDREHLPGRVGPPSRWEEGPFPPPREGRARRAGPPERVDRGDRDRDLAEPDLLELLARDLPPPMAVEGPLVPIETVMNVVTLYRNTPEAVHFVCTELDAGRVPDGIAGPSEGVPVPQILAMTPEGRKLLGEMHGLPPASPGGGAFPPHPMRPPHPSMIHEPLLPAPFMGSYGDMGPVPFEEMPPHPAFHAGPPVMPPRKRARWEEGRDAYAGYEADGVLPYSYTTPHPSQWHNDERPRKTHPAVARAASRAAGRGRPRGEDV